MASSRDGRNGRLSPRPWWFAITKLQALILSEGYAVKGHEEHERYLHHFGGGSGDAYKDARGMDVSQEEIYSWFNGRFPVNLSPSKSRMLRRLRRWIRVKVLTKNNRVNGGY
jgi:hypothetical protein